MRNQFAKSITEIASKNQSIFLVYGDIGNKLFDEFKSLPHSKYINAGIAEPSMVTFAAGLAKGGFHPVVYTINSFLYLKTLEQIKLDICYPQLPVVLVGTGGGLAYSELGTTHHSLEDYGVLSTIPNLQILVPSDELEADLAIKWAIESRKPTYIRIGKKGEGNLDRNNSVNTKESFGPFCISGGKLMKNAVISIGSISINVEKALKTLNNSSEFDHWTFPSIKPINLKSLINFSKYKKLYIVEEHNLYGSLGSLLFSEFISNNITIPEISMRNTGDKFHTGIGNIEDARKELGLSISEIVKFINDKK
jgi:transketolase